MRLMRLEKRKGHVKTIYLAINIILVEDSHILISNEAVPRGSQILLF